MAVTWKKLVFSDEIENFVESTDITDIVKLTQAQYDALSPGPDADTLYLIVPAT
jgi:hypothetical protein